MYSVYKLLREIPTETCDPSTKERYYRLTLILHVFGELFTTLLELVMAVVVMDIAVENILSYSSEEAYWLVVKEVFLEYFMRGLAILVTTICVLITALIYQVDG